MKFSARSLSLQELAVIRDGKHGSRGESIIGSFNRVKNGIVHAFFKKHLSPNSHKLTQDTDHSRLVKTRGAIKSLQLVTALLLVLTITIIHYLQLNFPPARYILALYSMGSDRCLSSL